MIVQTLENRFAVVQVLRSSPTEEVSVCRPLEGDQKERCLLVRFHDTEPNRKLLPMLTQQRKNSAFEDFLELFSWEGDLCARFRYTDAALLSDRLKEDAFSFQERLVIGRNLLERMTLLDMPPMLQFEALRNQNITVDDGLRVRFNYILEPLAAGRNVDLGFITLRVEELLRGLFAHELALRGVPELEEFLSELEHGEPRSYLELYAGFNKVSRLLENRIPEGTVEPGTWLFRLWEKIKKLKRFVWPVLSALVLVTAFCYLIYTLLLPPRAKGAPVLLDAIGTVEIQAWGADKSPALQPDP